MDLAAAPKDETIIENVTFDEMMIGQSASLSRKLGRTDIELFAAVSGDVNPAHLDEAYANSEIFRRVIAHGMWGGSLISAVLGTLLPGPGTIYLGQDLRFRRPVGIGDTITATVTVREKRPEKNVVIFDCACTNQDGKEVISGTAEVMAPTQKVRRTRMALPEVQVLRQEGYKGLLEKCTALPPLTTAVVYPVDEAGLRGAVEGATAGLIAPVLVGPVARIRQAADAAGLDISTFPLIDAPRALDAAKRAVALIHAGEAGALMRGSLPADILMQTVLRPGTGLRTGRRISHVYVMLVPTYPRMLLITDGFINIQPTLSDKIDICQNAIDLAQMLGIETPRVALLAAIGTVKPHFSSTIEAAALCKMADRGQITGGVFDGPLTLDQAIGEAYQQEMPRSEVAGRADVLVVPDLESGNLIAQQLSAMMKADAGGIVMGASVPIILTTRPDNLRTRLASCAVAALIAAARGQRPEPLEPLLHD